MHKFIIDIDPEYEDELTKMAIITWKSSLIKGQYIISTNNNMEFLKSLLFVKNVEINRKGLLC